MANRHAGLPAGGGRVRAGEYTVRCSGCGRRMARVPGNVDCHRLPPSDSARPRSAGVDRGLRRVAAAHRDVASCRGIPRRGDRAQRQCNRHGGARRLDRRSRRRSLQRDARRRFGDGKSGRRDLPGRDGTVCRCDGNLRVLVEVPDRERERDRPGPIGRLQGKGARGHATRRRPAREARRDDRPRIAHPARPAVCAGDRHLARAGSRRASRHLRGICSRSSLRRSPPYWWAHSRSSRRRCSRWLRWS